MPPKSSKPALTRSDLVVLLARGHNLRMDDAHQVMKAILDHLTTTLAGGHQVVLPGFGTFYLREVRPRAYYHPTTTKRLVSPSRATIAFRLARAIRQSIGGSRG